MDFKSLHFQSVACPRRRALVLQTMDFQSIVVDAAKNNFPIEKSVSLKSSKLSVGTAHPTLRFKMAQREPERQRFATRWTSSIGTNSCSRRPCSRS